MATIAATWTPTYREAHPENARAAIGAFALVGGLLPGAVGEWSGQPADDSAALHGSGREGSATSLETVNPQFETVMDTAADGDALLVERCLSGDEGAWEDLVRAHTRRVYSVCYRFTNRESEAQDLTQDVFLRVFKSLRSFRAGEGSFQVWLNRLTRNLLIDHYRGRKPSGVTDSIEDQVMSFAEVTPGTSRTEDRLEQRERSVALQAALQKLSPELRETLILRDLEDLEYREIAQILNVPEGTVKSRLNRGRAELARVLRKQKWIE